MTTSQKSYLHKKLGVNQASTHHMLHNIIEVVGLASTGFFIILIYEALTFIRGETGVNASKMLDHFVDHALASLNISLVSVAIFILGITLIFDGADMAGRIQKFVVRPLLNLFEHSCALTLGVAVGYFVLAVFDLKPRQEYLSVTSVIFMMVLVIALMIALRAIFEISARATCESIFMELIPKLSPEIVRSPEKLQAKISGCIRLVFVVVGVVLVLTALQQIPKDFKNSIKLSNTVTIDACNPHSRD